MMKQSVFGLCVCGVVVARVFDGGVLVVVVVVIVVADAIAGLPFGPVLL